MNKKERDLHCLVFSASLPLFTLSVSILAHIPSVDIMKHVNVSTFKARHLKVNKFSEINFVISDHVDDINVTFLFSYPALFVVIYLL